MRIVSKGKGEVFVFRRSCKAHYGQNVWRRSSITHVRIVPSHLRHTTNSRVVSKPSARDAQGSQRGRELVPLSGELFRNANHPCNVFLQIRNISTVRGRFSKTPSVLALLIPVYSDRWHDAKSAMLASNETTTLRSFSISFEVCWYIKCMSQ